MRLVSGTGPFARLRHRMRVRCAAPHPGVPSPQLCAVARGWVHSRQFWLATSHTHSFLLPAAPADESPPPTSPASVPAEPAEEGEEDEEEKCGFCRFMKAGPCRDVFVVRPLPLVRVLQPADPDTTPPLPPVLGLTHTGVGEVRGPEQGGGWRLRGGLPAVHPRPEAVHGGEPGVLRPAPGAHTAAAWMAWHRGNNTTPADSQRTHRMAATRTARGSRRVERSSHRRMTALRKRQRLVHQRRRMLSPARWVRRPHPPPRGAPCPRLPPRTRPPAGRHHPWRH